MDAIAASLRRERAISALLPLFFVSGATALTYQTLWGRQLHLVFGTSTFAIATVLSAFMAGLAIGGFVMGRYADSLKHPLAAYGWLEVGIGVYALVFPYIIQAITPLYLSLYTTFAPTPVLFGFLQFLLVGSTLLLPTALMGATLPLLARFATERLGAAGDRVGTLYSVNTAGAVFGTAACGFYLLPVFGLNFTTIAAAVANFLLGAGAIGLDRWARGSEADEVDVENDLEEVGFHPAVVPVSIAIGLAGFGSLVYEVAWFRVLGLMLGASVYAFSVMLLAFLIGIAIGGKIGGPLADRVLKARGQRGVFLTLAAVEVGVAITSYILMYVFGELPFWYVWLYDWFGADQVAGRMWWVSLMISIVIMTPPAVLMGIAFPVAVRAVIGDADKLGGPVGTVYGANTLGAVFGAALAGFVLLPTLHVQGTVFVAGAVNLAAAAVLVSWKGISTDDASAGKTMMLLPIAAVTVVLFVMGTKPPWDPMMMTAGMYKYVSMFDDHSRQGIIDYTKSKYTLLYYEEGLTSVVTVAQNKSTGNIWLANNGKVDASTTTDMPTQVMCSLLPTQFVDEPDDVMVIGLASGVTAGALTTVDEIKSLEIVEIEPAIHEAAKLFKDYNHDVLNDPRVKLVWNDGRNHVLLAEPGSYDVIVSEPPNAWITGVSNLFTKDFLEMGKTKLKPGGVWSQWVQMYGMDEDDLRSLLKTFASVYPHILLYSTVEDADLVLVGSESPIHPTYEITAKFMEDNPRVVGELKSVGHEDPWDVVALYRMGNEQIFEMAGDIEYNTDDNMRIEYSAPLNLHRDTQDENMRLILDFSRVPTEVLGEDPLKWADLARTYYWNDDPRGIVTMVGAAERAPKGSRLRKELANEARRYKKSFIDGVWIDDEDFEDPKDLLPIEPEDKPKGKKADKDGKGKKGKGKKGKGKKGGADQDGTGDAGDL